MKQSHRDAMVADGDEPQLGQLFRHFAGTSFERSLYRMMALRTRDWGNGFIAQGFPGFVGRAMCFAYDWLGRIFALDSSRLEEGLPAVVMFEPGSGQAFEVPCNLTTFHERELIDYRDAALAADLYSEWLAKGGSVPTNEQCVGYKKPLFLGGSDALENLALTDLDVYWAVCAQLIEKTRDLSSGTPIGKITITD